MRLPIDGDKLRLLADWFDVKDQEDGKEGEGEVQLDLRKAAAAADLLAEAPTTVCLVGSTRFADVFADKNLELTVAGKIVLSIGAAKPDLVIFGEDNHDLKHKLDILHLWKIVLADEVYCINVGGYIGASTARELGFANLIGRPITFHEPVDPGQAYRVNYDVPIEMVEAALDAVAALPRGSVQNVRGISLTSSVYCFLDGCPEQAAVLEKKPVRELHPLWVQDTRGGVTRWFCQPIHMLKFQKARRRGQENGYATSPPGNTHEKREAKRAKESALRDPKVEA